MQTEISTSFGNGVSASDAVIDAIGKLSRTDPVDVDFVLYEYVDPDALDALFRRASHGTGEIRVEFDVEDFEVTVRDDRTVAVRRSDVTTAAGDAREASD